jgi:succinyl-diaminopimelate desuccinylase
MTQAVPPVDPARLVANTKALIASDLPNELEGPRAQLVASMLDHPRIDVTIDPVLPGRPNVLGRVRGAGRGPGLLLNAHLDSAFVDVDQWDHPPREAWDADGRIYGGGVSDMLGGLAAMIEAMLALAGGEPPRGDVVLLASMHHDSNGVGTKYALANHDDWPTQAINGEPTGLTISSAHGGCIKFEVAFAGRSAHVSRIDEGRDALDAAIRFVADLKAAGFACEPNERLPGLPRFQIGMVQGGSGPSMVPALALVRGDLRTVPGMTWQTVRQDLANVLERNRTDGVESAVQPLVLQRPFIGRRNGPLIDALRTAHRMVRREEPGLDTDGAARSFVTDAADLTHAGIETLVYGPGAWRAEPNESVAIDELADAARIYASTAMLLGVR